MSEEPDSLQISQQYLLTYFAKWRISRYILRANSVSLTLPVESNPWQKRV